MFKQGFGRICDPVGDAHWSSWFLKCTPWEGSMLEKFMRSVSHRWDPMLERGKSMRSKDWQTHVMN